MFSRLWQRAAVIAAVCAAFACFATVAAAAVPNWSAAGPGSLHVSMASDGTSTFSYNDNGDYGQYSGQWWNFLATAPATGQLTYGYTFSGCHSWYLSNAALFVTVD